MSVSCLMRKLLAFSAFAGGGLVVACLLVLIGYSPTAARAGPAGVRSLVVGCAVSWLASCAAAVPIANSFGGDGSRWPLAILSGIAVRFLVVLCATVPLALSDLVEAKAFVIWVGVSYLSMLVVDTALTVVVANRRFSKGSAKE